MISNSTRSLTSEERMALSGAGGARSAGFSWGVLGMGAGILGGLGLVGGILVGLILHSLGYSVDGRVLMGAGAIFGAVGFLASVAISGFLQNRARARALKSDLTEGEARIIEVEASAIARCEPFEYLGEAPPAFFAQVFPGELIFLQGEYLFSALTHGKFPCTKFKIIRSIHSDTTLGIACGGKRINLHEIETEWIFDEECLVPADAQLIPGNLKTLPDDLRALKKPRKRRSK